MTTWFISRHAGASEWARQKGHIDNDARCEQELDPNALQPGDRVIGNLPAHLAAEVCERGARYDHLKLELPMDQRGQELTARQLDAVGAEIAPYFVEAMPQLRSTRKQALHVCIASGETLPNFLPLQVLELKPDEVVLLASTAMAAKVRRMIDALENSRGPKPQVRNDVPDQDVAAITSYGRKLARELALNYPKHRLMLNLTGGNKLMTIGLYQGMRSRFEIYYCDTTHDRLEWINPPERGMQLLDQGLLNLRQYLFRFPSGENINSVAVRHQNPLFAGVVGVHSASSRTIRHLMHAQCLMLTSQFMSPLHFVAGA